VCGIVGITGSCDVSLIDRMLRVIASRGPDGSKKVVEPGVVFGFTRLSINDLSSTGDQPMSSTDSRYMSMMNGEIYNAPQLRKELEARGYRFIGTSDAEVVPHGFSEWGVELFPRLRGMFAIAVFDRWSHQLVLARDHFGIKPLYYAMTNDGTCFASSARAVSLHPGVGQQINPSAVTEFLRFRYVKSGTPMYLNVRTVQPGEYVVSNGRAITRRRFWSRRRFSETAHASPDQLSEQFGELLKSSVSRELLSDVPLGVLLSGGVDSAAVLQSAIEAGAKNLIAYTYDMTEDASEVQDAAEIAKAHAVEHRVVSGNETEFADTYLRAVQCMDLPVGDAIIAPTYELLRSVRQDRKVVLTGEGADELMAGYAHIAPLRLLGRFAHLSLSRKVIASAVRLTPWQLLDAFFPYEAVLGKSGKAKVVDIIRSSYDASLALDNATSIFSPAELGLDDHLALYDSPTPAPGLDLASLIDWGFDSWLPNQILNKIDQLSMAHGVEARVPYVDVELYEFVAALPTRLLISRKGNKRILRDTLDRWRNPVAERPKRAFFTPVNDRHRRELTFLAKEWLSPAATKRHGIIADTVVTRTMSKLNGGDFLAAKQVATLAALHIWLDQDFLR